MKKVLVVMVGLAVALSFAIASAKTVDKGTFTSPNGKLTWKIKQAEKKGFTTEKGKYVNIGKDYNLNKGVRVETLKFKSYQANNPGNANDDYVTFLTSKGETVMRRADPKVNTLKGAKTNKMKVYSTYNIMDAGWHVVATELE